jgi:hypothetical protein
MKRFIYVEAREPRDTDGQPGAVMLSFAHAFVMARDEDHAYDIGPDAIEADLMSGQLEAQGHDTSWPLVNDYVIAVP